MLKILFIYLTQRERQRERTQTEGVGKGEAGFPRSREPDAGPDPWALGSSLMRGSIPGPWDHDLSRRQTPND